MLTVSEGTQGTSGTKSAGVATARILMNRRRPTTRWNTGAVLVAMLCGGGGGGEIGALFMPNYVVAEPSPTVFRLDRDLLTRNHRRLSSTNFPPATATFTANTTCRCVVVCHGPAQKLDSCRGFYSAAA